MTGDAPHDPGSHLIDPMAVAEPAPGLDAPDPLDAIEVGADPGELPGWDGPDAIDGWRDWVGEHFHDVFPDATPELAEDVLGVVDDAGSPEEAWADLLARAEADPDAELDLDRLAHWLFGDDSELVVGYGVADGRPSIGTPGPDPSGPAVPHPDPADPQAGPGGPVRPDADGGVAAPPPTDRPTVGAAADGPHAPRPAPAAPPAASAAAPPAASTAPIVDGHGADGGGPPGGDGFTSGSRTATSSSSTVPGRADTPPPGFAPHGGEGGAPAMPGLVGSPAGSALGASLGGGSHGIGGDGVSAIPGAGSVDDLAVGQLVGTGPTGGTDPPSEGSDRPGQPDLLAPADGSRDPALAGGVVVAGGALGAALGLRGRRRSDGAGDGPSDRGTAAARADGDDRHEEGGTDAAGDEVGGPRT